MENVWLLQIIQLLSLLAIGGAITTAPDMHRYLVTEHGWISDSQFTASIALAQAAPGPFPAAQPAGDWRGDHQQ
eukprot:gene46205-62588_t